MRKFYALAALVLGLASCQQDVDTVAPVGGEVDFQLKVAAPELAQTRAHDLDGDSQYDYDSAYGAIDYFKDSDDDYRRDWNEVNLRYTLEVYDKADSYVDAVPVKDRQVIIVDKYEPVVFDLRLIPNRDYHFVVFADFVPQTVTDKTQSTAIALQQNLGISHTIGATLADIKLNNHGLNDERTDAYFAAEDITITNSAAQDIVLKRPYGKVRVIATDLHELNLNVNPKAVKVEYTAPHLTNFNAVTGKATVDTNNEKVVFDSEYNAIYKEVDKGGLQNHFYTTGYDALEGHKYTTADGKVRHTHMTLFTDYILANATEQEAIHFTMTVYEEYDNKAEDGRAIKSTTFTTDIPVERNKLTTVIGNVLTTATEIEVRIDDNFAGENVKNMVFVNTAKEFQEALDNYVNGQTIILEADIKGNVTVDQVEGKDYVIDGNGNNYDGTIYIDGNSRNDGTETVTIRNFNFATDSSDINFIEQNSTDGAVRYAHNVTIENCSFRATGVNVVAVKIRQGYNITIKNCVADGVTRANDSGMHSLGQFYGCTGITIDGVNFNNAGEGGVSFGTSTNVVVKNSTFVTGYYGVRADASVETTLKLENVNITAMIPVIARQCTADYAIELTGENTMEAAGYDIVFTQGGDKAAFVAPTSNFSVTGADEFIVFPRDKMHLYAYNLAGLQYLLDNAVNGDTIQLVADIEGDVTVSQKADVKITIEGNKHKYAGVITVDGKSKTYTTAGVTIKNLNFEAETISADACIRLGDGTDPTRYACNVAVEGCTFNVPGVVAVKSYTGGDKNLTIKGCTATGLHSLLQVKNVEGVTIEGVNVTGGRGASFGASSNIVVKNSTFVAESYGLRADASVATTLEIENVNITAKLPVVARKCTADYAIKLTGANTMEAPGYDIVFTTGNDDATFVAPTSNFSVTGADGLAVFPSDNMPLYAYNVGDLQNHLNNATDGATIYVMEDINGDVVATQKENVKVTIEGNKHKYAGVILVDGKSKTYTTAGVTIKNLNFEADAISADACIRLGKDNNSRYTCNVTVDSCTFDVPGAVGVKSYTGGDKNLKITNCTATDKAHSLVQAKGIDGILVEKCTVNSKNGMNFNNSTNVTVDQCTTDVKGYAVRYGESSGGAGAAEKYYISNSTLKSACEDGDAVVVLRGTADYATLTITNTTLDGTIKVTNKAKDAKVIIDGKEMVEAASQSELNDIVAAGGDVAVTLAGGNYSLPSINGGDVAISGGKDVVITINKPNLSGSDITFTGVTVKGSGYATGVQHVNTVTYNDVTINGEMCLYGAKNVFNNCTFNLAAGQYIWTYGSDETEFNNCTFNTAGKAILVYNEGDGACEVKVDGCKFYASAAGYAGAIKNQACAAVEIDNFQNPAGTNNGAAHKVTYTNTNTYDSNFSGGWRIKNYEAGNPITVNGVDYTQIAIDGNLMTIDADKNISYM